MLLEGVEVARLAASNERLGRALQLFPTTPDLDGLGGVDLIVGRGAGDDRQKVGELLNHSIGGRNQVFRVRVVGLGIADEEPAGPLAQPVDEPQVPGALHQLIHAIQRIVRSRRGLWVRLFGPFVNQRQRQPHIAGDLLGTGGLQDIPDNLKGVHANKVSAPPTL